MRFDPYAIVDSTESSDGTAAKLREKLEGVTDGRIYNVPLPWPMMTNLTQALLPGSICVVCGDPNVGKTFWILQCLQHWYANDHSAAVFFVEKDRTFYAHRLLAQLEGDSKFIDLEWIKAHPVEWEAAMNRNAEFIDELGESIHTHSGLLNLEHMLAWVREQCNAGVRVIVIDPITAVSAGNARWEADQQFMIDAQNAVGKAGASLMLVTHPKQGWKGSSSGHAQAGGAAYYRFSDTNIWLARKPEPTDVRVQTHMGPIGAKLAHFAQLIKTRDARGAGLELGFEFGHGLMFAEQGVVINED